MRPWHQDDDAGTWLIIGLRHQGTCTVQAVTELGSSSATLTVASAADQPATDPLTGAGFVNLKITFTGSGSGSVSSSDLGFSCQTDCTKQITSSITLSENPANATPTPTATPTGTSQNVSSFFFGWGGACAASRSDPTCALNLKADDQVTAQFDINVS